MSSSISSKSILIGKKRKNVKHACDFCRRRKMKCNGNFPCLNCLNHNNECKYQYISTTEIKVNLPQDNLSTDSIKDATAASTFSKIKNANITLRQNIEMLNENLDSLKSHLSESPDPLIHANLNKLLRSNVVLQQTIELNDLKNKNKIIDYNKIVDSIETTLENGRLLFPGNHNNILKKDISKRKFATVNFGLYCFRYIFSPRGIVWVLQHIAKYSRNTSENSNRYIQDLSESYILILKIVSQGIDLVMFNQSLYHDYNLKSSSIDIDEKIHEYSFIDGIFPPVFQKMCGTKLFPQKNDDFVVKLQKISKLKKKLDQVYKENAKSVEFFSEKLEFSNVYSLLTIWWNLIFQKHFITAPLWNLSVLKACLEEISNLWFYDETEMLTYYLPILIRHSNNLGLNRWEYYIGIEENIANEMREIWWEINWLDKWYSIKSGKSYEVNEQLSNVLFPNYLRRLNITESMTISELIKNFEFTANNIKPMIKLGYIILTKLSSLAQNNVLFNANYTSFTINSELYSFFENNSLLQKLLADINLIKEYFNLLDMKISFREICMNNFSKENNNLIVFFIDFHELRMYIFSHFNSLLMRIVPNSNDPILLTYLTEKMRKYLWEISMNPLIELQENYTKISSELLCIRLINFCSTPIFMFPVLFLNDLENIQFIFFCTFCNIIEWVHNWTYLISSTNNFLPKSLRLRMMMFEQCYSIFLRICMMIFVNFDHKKNKKNLEGYLNNIPKGYLENPDNYELKTNEKRIVKLTDNSENAIRLRIEIAQKELSKLNSWRFKHLEKPLKDSSFSFHLKSLIEEEFAEVNKECTNNEASEMHSHSDIVDTIDHGVTNHIDINNECNRDIYNHANNPIKDNCITPSIEKNNNIGNSRNICGNDHDIFLDLESLIEKTDLYTLDNLWDELNKKK